MNNCFLAMWGIGESPIVHFNRADQALLSLFALFTSISFLISNLAFAKMQLLNQSNFKKLLHYELAFQLLFLFVIAVLEFWITPLVKLYWNHVLGGAMLPDSTQLILKWIPRGTFLTIAFLSSLTIFYSGTIIEEKRRRRWSSTTRLFYTLFGLGSITLMLFAYYAPFLSI